MPKISTDTLVNSFNQDNITFSDFNIGTVKQSGKIIANSTVTIDSPQAYVVNAIDIDWNNAELGTYILKTTGQLLSYISKISEKLNNIETVLINI